MIIDLLLYPFILATLISWVSSWLIIRVYHSLGWLDDPKVSNHPKVIHSYPVPRGGGIAIFIALLISMLVVMGLDKHVLGILLGGAILAITGWWDDLKDINPYFRLLLGILAALAVVGSGIGIAFVTNPFSQGVIHLDQPQLSYYLFGVERTIWILADALAVIWIVWCMNMMNWSKGLDGQLPGIVVVAASVIGILSYKFHHDITQWPVTVLAAITAGCFLGLLYWNIYPQKIMPGYGGGSIAGYLLAVLSILSGAKVATLILVVSVPMIDALYVIVSRIRRRQSPVWGDRNHLHHKLLDLGWGKHRVAVFYWSMSLAFGLLSLGLNAKQKAFTIVAIIMGFIGALVWIRYLLVSSKQSDQDNG